MTRRDVFIRPAPLPRRSGTPLDTVPRNWTKCDGFDAFDGVRIRLTTS